MIPLGSKPPALSLPLSLSAMFDNKICYTTLGPRSNNLLFHHKVEHPGTMTNWKAANGGAKRIVRFWGGTYYRVRPQKPLLEAPESGICLVCAYFL